MKLLSITLSLLLALWSCGAAAAEPLASAIVPVTVRIPQIIRISVSAEEIVFETSDFDVAGTAIQVENGIIAEKAAGLSIDMAGNIAYMLQVSSVGDWLIGANGEQLPFSQLSWRISEEDGGGDWHQFNTTDAAVVQREQPGVVNIRLDFRLLATWDDYPGTYEGTILYTVVPLI